MGECGAGGKAAVGADKSEPAAEEDEAVILPQGRERPPGETDVSRILAAVVQMTSTADVEKNLGTAERLVAEAASRGARFVGLPENFAFLRSEGEMLPEPQSLGGAWVSRLAAAAVRHSVTLLLGSVPERIDGDRRVYNTSLLLGSDGRTLAVYRKIHLFDTDLPDLEHLKESRSVAPGGAIVLADAAFAPIGLSICYDLRFPELYRALVRRGALILAVPSAFTERTGKDHWEVLLRARAIENLAFVVAPAQVGVHGRGRSSHGHAMIVDPWGTIIAQVGGGEGVALAELDFDRLRRVRRELPALSHVRLRVNDAASEAPEPLAAPQDRLDTHR